MCHRSALGFVDTLSRAGPSEALCSSILRRISSGETPLKGELGPALKRKIVPNSLSPSEGEAALLISLLEFEQPLCSFRANGNASRLVISICWVSRLERASRPPPPLSVANARRCCRSWACRGFSRGAQSWRDGGNSLISDRQPGRFWTRNARHYWTY